MGFAIPDGPKYEWEYEWSFYCPHFLECKRESNKTYKCDNKLRFAAIKI